MANCLCTDGDLQKKLATCVIGSCNAEEQFSMSLSITLLTSENMANEPS